MEKKIGFILIAVYGVWFFTGQNIPEYTQSIEQSKQEAHMSNHTSSSEIENVKLTHKQMHHTIKSVAQNEGWIVTEFKSNALIAEKIGEGDSIAVTVTFNKNSFSISPQNSDLEDVLNRAFKI